MTDDKKRLLSFIDRMTVEDVHKVYVYARTLISIHEEGG